MNESVSIRVHLWLITMALPKDVDNSLRMTASVTLFEIENMARDNAFPVDEYPLFEWMAALEPTTCPFCRHMDGKILDRRTDGKRNFPPAHINCMCIPVYISREEVGPDGEEVRADFKPDADYQELLDKHAHFIFDPNQYEPLRVRAFVDGREFVFKRIKDAVTGEMKSVIVWESPPRTLAGLFPETEQVTP